MPATIVSIADAVTAQLNGTSFSQAFTAERQYLPTFELSAMSSLRVTVVPNGMTNSYLDRTRDSVDYKIDVAIQKKTSGDNASLDALMLLVQEIADQFRRHPLLNYPEARFMKVDNLPVYAMDHLQELRQFTSVLTFTFRVWRMQPQS